MADKTLTLGTKFIGDATQLIATVSKVRTAVKGMTTSMTGAGTASTRAARGISSVAPAAAGVSKATNKASVAMDSMRKGAGLLFNAYDRFTRALKVVTAYGLAGAAIYNIITAMKAGVAEIINYDQALKNLAAITGATASEIVIMDEAMRDVARTTKFSTGEIAEGMVLLGQAGFDASESLDAIHSTAMLATATLTSMQTTADLLTTSIRAFSLSTKESSRVADVMANAVTKSKLTIDKLRTAFNFVGAAAAQAGISLEQTAATMMVLANNGLRASTIGTGFRQVLARLISPSDKLRESYEAYGISLEKISPITAGYAESLKNLSKVLWDHEKGMVDMVKAYDLFKLRGAQAAAIIVKSYMSGDFRKALDHTYEVGTAAEMAAIQQTGLLVSFKNLADRAKLVAVALGDAGLKGAFRVLIDVVATVVTAMEYLVKSSMGSFILQVGVLTATLLGLGKVLVMMKGWLLGVIATMTAGMASMGFYRAMWISISTTLARFITPVTAVIAVLAIAAVALYRFGKRQQEAAKAAEENAVKIKAVADSLDTFEDVLSSAEVGSRKYSSTLKRMIKEHPELAEEIKRAAERMLGLTSVVDLSALSFEDLKTVLDKLEMEKRIESFKEQGKAIDFLAGEAKKWALELETTTDGYNALDVAMESSAATQEIANKKIKESDEALKAAAGTLAGWITEGKLSEKATLALIDTMVELGTIAPAVGKAIKDHLVAGLKLLADQSGKTKTEMEAFIADLPLDFQEYYKKLDVLRQVDFVKVKKKIAQELAEYKKHSVDLTLTDEQRNAAKYAIQLRALADYKAGLYKEYESEEENAARKLQVLKDFQEQAKQTYLDKLTANYEVYEKEVAAAEENEKAIAEITKRYLTAKEGLIRDHLGIVEGANVASNQIMLDGLKATYEAASKIIKSQLTDLKSELKTLESDLESTLDKIKSIEESYHEGLRGLKQKTMTDEEKWLDDRKEANRLLNEAIQTGDAETAEAARDAYKDLARIVKDESGETIRGIEETVKIAQGGFEKAHTVLTTLLSQQAHETRNQIQETEDSIASLNVEMEKYKTLTADLAERNITLSVSDAIIGLDEVMRQVDILEGKLGAGDEPLGIKIDTSQAVISISEVTGPLDELLKKIGEMGENQVLMVFRGRGSTTTGLVEKLNEIGYRFASIFKLVKDLAKTWITELKIIVIGLDNLRLAKKYYDGLKDKTITITIHTVYTSSGKKSGDSGGSSGGGGEGMQAGGLVPGTGVGDKIHALLEPTEFVINKEAVAKYGAGLFDLYNKMLVNISSGFKKGGIVLGSQRPRKMQEGGPAMTGLTSGGNTYHLTVSPMFMTGDRRSLEEAAIVLKSKLEDLDGRGY